MIRYVIFKRYYRNKQTNYKFIPKVKYLIKGEDSKYYFTIKNVKLSKKAEFELYEVHST